MLRRVTRFRCICLFYAPLSFLTACEPAFAEMPAIDVSAGVREAVLGIMSYSRWPQPPPALRLCVVGQPDYADALFAGAMQVGKTPVDVSRKALRTGDISGQCDAVYTGGIDAAERRSLRPQLASHPILTITEDDPTCSDGSMFCLDTSGTGAHVGFAVDLDSIARSGVQVNPRVLLLGRRPKAAP
jgi:hypothetical protein